MLVLLSPHGAFLSHKKQKQTNNQPLKKARGNLFFAITNGIYRLISDDTIPHTPHLYETIQLLHKMLLRFHACFFTNGCLLLLGIVVTRS